MATYYIDNVRGSDAASGLSPDEPLRSYRLVRPEAGDTVLFRRGSVYRDTLDMVGGDSDMPVTYGAFGEGDMPTFVGSVDLSASDCWAPTDRENVWRCTVPIQTEIANLVFNGDECTAALVWDIDRLSHQGDFHDSRFGECNQNGGRTVTEQLFLLYSSGNPAEVWEHIEAVPYGRRVLGAMKSHTVIENIRFKNSGVHALATSKDTEDVTVRGCEFLNIGGAVWSREKRIRFGNGVEFWIGARNITIENNHFKNIYDSCATHQGPSGKTPPARNFHVRNNLFDTYSMAAFEYRNSMMIASSFTGNTCKNAGCGFGILGEELPRRSEIWPRPMGHHLFLWRIPEAADGGSLLVADNLFDSAPNGAAVYSLISPEAEAQITFRDNTYIGEYLITAFMDGKETTLD